MLMAKLARKIGYGKDAIYHGTRHPMEVLRTGKLKPSRDVAVYFTRSPEEAARFAYLWGNEFDHYSPGLLVFSRRSLSQTYRLTPSRDCEDWWDEREEHVWNRTINIRRHLLGCVRESDVAKVLGPRKLQYASELNAMSKEERFAYGARERRALSKLLEGRVIFRDRIIREREFRSKNALRLLAASRTLASGTTKSGTTAGKRRRQGLCMASGSR
jgi:hypothetical protein